MSESEVDEEEVGDEEPNIWIVVARGPARRRVPDRRRIDRRVVTDRRVSEAGTEVERRIGGRRFAERRVEVRRQLTERRHSWLSDEP